jgi:hypothetical protein
MIRLSTSDDLFWYLDPTNATSTGSLYASTTNWQLIAATRLGGASITPRNHLNSGSGWTHAAMSGTTSDPVAITGTSRMIVGRQGAGSLFFDGDIVCIGVKKANSSDIALEALSLTSFAPWKTFGFDWLVGFDAAGTRTNVTTPGSGDETARSGTSLVSDPPGWSFGGGGGGSVGPRAVDRKQRTASKAIGSVASGTAPSGIPDANTVSPSPGGALGTGDNADRYAPGIEAV